MTAPAGPDSPNIFASDRPMSSEASTPLMRQYNAIKEQAPNALLMFRLLPAPMASYVPAQKAA